MSPSARSPQQHKLVGLTAGSKDNQDALFLIILITRTESI